MTKNAGNILLIFLFLLPLFLFAKTGQKKIESVKLRFVDYYDENGKVKGHISIASLIQTSDTLYFEAEGTNMFCPIYVSLDDSLGTTEIGLYGENAHNIETLGNTTQNHHWDVWIKNEGSFGIRVVPAKLPAKYTLLVYKAPEVLANIPLPFKKSDVNPAAASASRNNMLISGLVAAIAILLGIIIFMFFKNNNNAA